MSAFARMLMSSPIVTIAAMSLSAGIGLARWLRRRKRWKVGGLSKIVSGLFVFFELERTLVETARRTGVAPHREENAMAASRPRAAVFCCFADRCFDGRVVRPLLLRGQSIDLAAQVSRKLICGKMSTR